MDNNTTIKYFPHMKSIVLLVVLLSLASAHAQPPPLFQKLDKYKVIDTVSYVVTYQLSFKDDKTKTKVNDIVVLEIGRNFAKSFSSTLFKSDSVAAEWVKRGADAVPQTKNNAPVMDVYRNRTAKSNTVIFRSILSGPVYRYEEKSNLMIWTISPETKDYSSYPCQKATTEFRGREFEAWFAKDIPLHEGPWKFDGLPGLILYVKDTQDDYVFECIGIEKVKTPYPMKYWSWNYENAKREQLQKTIKKMYLDTYNYCMSIGQAVGGDPAEAKRKMVYPHNPIELE